MFLLVPLARCLPLLLSVSLSQQHTKYLLSYAHTRINQCVSSTLSGAAAVRKVCVWLQSRLEPLN